MLDKLKPLLITILILYSFGLTISFFTERSNHLLQLESTNELIEVERATKHSLESQIKEYSKQQLDLLELISALDTDVKNLKYITKTETTIKASNPVVEYQVLPEHYSYKLENGLRVADFSTDSANNKYVFETYDLSFRAAVVASDKKASSTLEVKSSYDDQWIQVPHELDFNNVEAPRKLFEPKLIVGGQSSIVPLEPSGLVGITFVHPSELVHIGTIGVGISDNPSINIYPLDINIGKPLPVLTDLHVGAGATTTLTFSPTFTLGIWTTL